MSPAEQTAFDACVAALRGVLNSAAHPDIAIRAVLVNLAPVRAALATVDALNTSSG